MGPEATLVRFKLGQKREKKQKIIFFKFVGFTTRDKELVFISKSMYPLKTPLLQDVHKM